jgi:hypothetical protein
MHTILFVYKYYKPYVIFWLHKWHDNFDTVVDYEKSFTLKERMKILTQGSLGDSQYVVMMALAKALKHSVRDFPVWVLRSGQSAPSRDQIMRLIYEWRCTAVHVY